MIALSAFLPWVLPFAAHCAEPVAKRAILDAAIDFCEQTAVIQLTLDPISTVQERVEYELALPNNQELVVLKRAWFKGTELVPVPTAAVGKPEAWRTTVPGVDPQAGDPQAFYQAARNVVGLYPRPQSSEANVLTVRAATKPSRSATQVEDELFHDWAETIAAGALARLLATPGQSYTDMNRALGFRMDFQLGANKAKYRANYGRTNGELTVTMRPFA